MNLPFTPEQFFQVFALYNRGVWPMQFVLNAFALACIALLFHSSATASRGISLMLSLLWVWVAIAYHFAFFSRINPAAWLFGALFLAGGLVFAWLGVVQARLQFRPPAGGRGVLGSALLLYALLVYPLLGYMFGHRYPQAPTFGLPCPTTIFTIGLLLLAVRPLPRLAFLMPVLWAAVGSFAPFQLGALEDLGLLAAGVLAVPAGLLARRPASPLSPP